MTGSSVSAVTAYTAHREWASRPPDERYASVHALYEAARSAVEALEERLFGEMDCFGLKSPAGVDQPQPASTNVH